jgi:hypothetical protein
VQWQNSITILKTFRHKNNFFASYCFFAVPVHAVGGVIFPLFPVFGSEMATEKF